MDQKCVNEGFSSLVEIAKIPGSGLASPTARAMRLLETAAREFAPISRLVLECKQLAVKNPAQAEERFAALKVSQEEALRLLRQAREAANDVMECAELGIAYEKKVRGWGLSTAIWNGAAVLGICARDDTSTQRQNKLEALQSEGLAVRTYLDARIREIMNNGLVLRSLFPELCDLTQAERLDGFIKNMSTLSDDIIK